MLTGIFVASYVVLWAVVIAQWAMLTTILGETISLMGIFKQEPDPKSLLPSEMDNILGRAVPPFSVSLLGSNASFCHSNLLNSLTLMLFVDAEASSKDRHRRFSSAFRTLWHQYDDSLVVACIGPLDECLRLNDMVGVDGWTGKEIRCVHDQDGELRKAFDVNSDLVGIIIDEAATVVKVGEIVTAEHSINDFVREHSGR